MSPLRLVHARVLYQLIYPSQCFQGSSSFQNDSAFGIFVFVNTNFINVCFYEVLGSEESKSVQAKKKEQYRRDLQQQMQEQADNKKRYKACIL